MPLPADLTGDSLTPSARKLGAISGAAVAFLCLAYAVILLVGLLSLPSPNRQIQQPWFTIMEVLIICISPAMVALTVALHAGASTDRKSLALASVVFMSMSAVITCTVHFAILTLARNPAFASEPWARSVFSFQWPSVAYALDILSWDVLFPVAALFAALSVQGPGLASAVRVLLYASAALAFLGLAGVAVENMQVRNVGILGYAVLFPIAAGLLASLFHKAGNDNAA